MYELIRLEEPKLQFRFEQRLEDPRDGLTLFGPLSEGAPYGLRAGVVGTSAGLDLFRRWVDRIQRPVCVDPPKLARPPFPGFEAVFGIPWDPEPVLTIEIDRKKLDGSLYLDDRPQRIYQTVELFASPIVRALTEEDVRPDIWFVVVPDEVRKYCRPMSPPVDPELRQSAIKHFASRRAAKEEIRRLDEAPALFPELDATMSELVEPYRYAEHFRNQLKARLLEHKISTQVLRESTIANVGPAREGGPSPGDVRRQSEIAWNVSTAAFYKAWGRPWKVADIREGVCYVGLVFKKDSRSADPRSACCAAQMFLDSGDGVVFKGAVGPWYSPETGDFHLTREAAEELVALAVTSYRDKTKEGLPPRELFLHGKVGFHNEEWEGFRDAVDSRTRLVGVKIRDDSGFKLYRTTDTPILRGLAYVRYERLGYLWTRGWTPRLQTYPGREVPNPLTVELNRGEASIETVLQDILALTKLNYNSCIFGDGQPITLKFANAVGEVLTAGPVEGIPPLPFQYYI